MPCKAFSCVQKPQEANYKTRKEKRDVGGETNRQINGLNYTHILSETKREEMNP